MKVLIVGQLPSEVGGTYTTGVCNVVYELSKCHENGVECYVYATNISDKNAKLISNNYFGSVFRVGETILRVLIHPISTFREWLYYKFKAFMSPIRCEMYKDNITRVVRELSPDIIHCMSWIQLPASYFVCKKYNIPLIVTFHGVLFNPSPKNVRLYKNLIKLPNSITTLTNDGIIKLNNLGCSAQSINLVPNGTDTNKFHFDLSERHSLRRYLNIDDDTILLLTVGSLQHRKGQLSFCKILSSMPESFNYKYIIIGSGPDSEEIQRYIHDKQLSSRISVVGYVSNTELYKYYSASDIYIHSSLAEGQALSEVEAYTCDLKIAVNAKVKDTIVSDITIANDYFIYDESRFDVMKFHNWACQIKSDRKTRSGFDWNIIFKKYIDVYRKLINSN